MSYEWNERDFRAARSVRVPSGLSQSLAKALFGAAIGTLPGAALANEDETVATAAVLAPAAATIAPAAAAPVVAAAAAPTQAPIVLPVAASAEQRSYGPLRPGLGTPVNTMVPGQISIETGLVDWQRDDTDGVGSDTLLVGATTVRIGITRSIEAMAGGRRSAMSESAMKPAGWNRPIGSATR